MKRVRGWGLRSGLKLGDAPSLSEEDCSAHITSRKPIWFGCMGCFARDHTAVKNSFGNLLQNHFMTDNLKESEHETRASPILRTWRRVGFCRRMVRKPCELRSTKGEKRGREQRWAECWAGLLHWRNQGRRCLQVKEVLRSCRPHTPEQGPPSEDWPQDSHAYTSPLHEMAEHCKYSWNIPLFT